ncbi:hypothetical protein K7H94_03400 [Pantoea dispersa]|uniref:hypothetical protein n=1 Tax=Pantoea dispersa TaxID=59814 RepID=UPI001CA68018|nr:hypothetical protein [Pantoea dispersa]QZY90996.1 hypothetical protein K7H94_03400 [Pantoea dispersa]
MILQISCKADVIIFDENIKISLFQKKKEIITNLHPWEDWLRNDDGEVVSYRLKLGNKHDGFVYLIVTFKPPVNENALVATWFIAPEGLIEGQQKKASGKVTKRLRDWFFKKTQVLLPTGGEWGHIDASYDPWNSVGMIVCNYKTAFEDQEKWREYRRSNLF